MASPPPEERTLAPVCIAFGPDQLSWLDDHAKTRRTSRSAVVRQAVDLLIKYNRRQPADGL